MKTTGVAVLVVAAATASLATPRPAVALPTPAASVLPAPPSPPTSWRAVLARASRAADGTEFQARMVVVTLDDDGPHLGEVELHHGRGGDVQIGRTEAWLIGSVGDEAFFQDEHAGHLLRLGTVDRIGFDADLAGRNYDVSVAEIADLDTGPATAIRFDRRGVLREQLFVDDATGLVVRRETFGAGGRPHRVVALTDLRTTAEPLTMPDMPTQDWRHRDAVAADAATTLAASGWPAPDALPGGLVLVSALRVDDGAAVQLVYTDGLYSLSLYEQPGNVDRGALAGAEGYSRGGTPVYRWPGAEPERVVWSGGGYTFTAVTDAPMDAVMDAVAALPHDPAASRWTRLGRGLRRVAQWLWPFD